LFTAIYSPGSTIPINRLLRWPDGMIANSHWTGVAYELDSRNANLLRYRRTFLVFCQPFLIPGLGISPNSDSWLLTCAPIANRRNFGAFKSATLSGCRDLTAYEDKKYE
jgi:hypothetical protein